MAVLLLIQYSCGDYFFDCLRGNGNVITEERVAEEDIYGVILEGSYDVEVIIDDDQKIVIEWDDNLIPYVSTRVTGGDLIVKPGTRHCLRSAYPTRLFVYTPSVDKVMITGSGTVVCDDLNSGSLKVVITGSGYIDMRNIDVQTVNAEITGSGTILLEGTADLTDFSITGSGKFRTFDLVRETCIAKISGSGDMQVFASDLLDCTISGSGNVYYRGNPRVVAHISGSGNIIDSN